MTNTPQSNGDDSSLEDRQVDILFAYLNAKRLVGKYNTTNGFAKMMGAALPPDDYEPELEAALEKVAEACFGKPYSEIRNTTIPLSPELTQELQRITRDIEQGIRDKQTQYLDTIMEKYGFVRQNEQMPFLKGLDTGVVMQLRYGRPEQEGLPLLQANLSKYRNKLWLVSVNSVPFDSGYHYHTDEAVRLGSIDEAMDGYFSK